MMDDQRGSRILCFRVLVDQDEIPALEIVQEPGGRIDDKRGSADDEKIRFHDGDHGFRHHPVIQRLLIEDNVRLDDAAAMRTAGDNVRTSRDERGIIWPMALHAEIAVDGSVELDDVTTSRLLVETVDVLRHDGLEFPLLFELGKIKVARIRFLVQKEHPFAIKAIELFRIPHEEVMGDDLFGIVTIFLVVETILAAEVRDSRLRGDAGTTEKDNVRTIVDKLHQGFPVLFDAGHSRLPIPYIIGRNAGFPNREVEQGFFRFLLPNYASVSVSKSPYEIQCFVEEVRHGDVDGFLNRLRTFFNDTPYELARDREVHYQNILYIVFKLMGFHTEVEYRTSRGRVDLVLKTSDYIYIMEFKLNGSAEEAIKQIEEKGYASAFSCDKRKLIKVGINFNDEIRSIERWIIA